MGARFQIASPDQGACNDGEKVNTPGSNCNMKLTSLKYIGNICALEFRHKIGIELEIKTEQEE
jgi:hypothetical protein